MKWRLGKFLTEKFGISNRDSDIKPEDVCGEMIAKEPMDFNASYIEHDNKLYIIYPNGEERDLDNQEVQELVKSLLAKEPIDIANRLWKNTFNERLLRFLLVRAEQYINQENKLSLDIFLNKVLVCLIKKVIKTEDINKIKIHFNHNYNLLLAKIQQSDIDINIMQNNYWKRLLFSIIQKKYFTQLIL